MKDTLIQKTATVESIDQASRLVTLRREDGSATTVRVSDEVRNLPQVKVGDKVVVSYYEAIAVEVKKPGEGVQGVEADVSAVRAEPGEKPAVGAGVVLRTTVVIDSVDTQFNTVTFKNSDGSAAHGRRQDPGRPEVHQGPEEGRPGRSGLHRGGRDRSEAGGLSRHAGSGTCSASRAS